MRNYLVIFLCLLLVGVQALAQKTFPGSYVSTEGEKVPVTFTNYRQWEHNPAQVKAVTAQGQELTLTPQNAQSFTIDGYDTYVSRRFSRLLNPIGELKDSRTLSDVDSVEEVHGFLLLLAEGSGVRFYRYSDKQRPNFYIEKDSLQELRYKMYMKDANTLVHDTRYQEQLRVVFADRIAANPKLGVILERLEYRESFLQNFMKQTLGITTKKERRYRSDLMVRGGIAFNSFTAEGRKSEATLADYNANMAPVIGIGYMHYNQRNLGRNFFLVQGEYYRFKHSGDYNYNPGMSASYQPGVVTFQGSLFNFGVGFGRKFIQSKGVAVYAALVPHFQYLYKSRETYTTYGEKSNLSRGSYNVSLQAGVRLASRLGFWANYDLMATDVQKYVLHHYIHRSIKAGVDWNLKRR